MAITKIKDSDYSNKGIRVKNNPLGLSVSEAQRAFDELSLDVIIPAVNRMAGEIDTTVSELQNKDTTNSTAIAKNTADISTNKSDISKNKTDISQNKTDITDIKGKVSALQIDISQKAEKDNVLSKDNTEIFVPAENYNPATKKYVDDLTSASGGGDMLKTVYDKQNKGLDIYEYVDKHIGNKNNPHSITAEQIGALTNESLTKEAILNKIDVLDIAHGGTGKATKKEAFNNLAYLGNNPISSTEEDTPQKWLELGSGYAKFDTNNLMNNQPEQYMFVINCSHESSAIFQIGSLQSGNGVYYRTGNYNGWTVNWTPLLSTNDKTLLATTIQNLIDKGEIHMEKQYIISDSGMTTETFANNVSCIGLHSNEIKVLGKFFPQYNGLILVKTKATNNYNDSLSLHHSNLHDGNRYGSSSLHSAENYYMTNQAAADKEATMLYNNVKISPGTILNNADTTLVSMSSEIDTWYQNATGYSYKVLMVQKNMPVTFYCNSSNSKSDSGLTNITLQIMYKVV